MTDIEGKVALVTGGSRGIGAAVALRLAEAGADVALTYQKSADRASAVVDQIKARGRRGLAIQADSGDVAEIIAAVNEAAETYGRLDILVNNAGVFTVGPVGDLSLAEFERTIGVNVRGPFVASQAAARHMSHGSRIINIGSNIASRTVFPGFSLYALSKSALEGMTKGLARDLGPDGITVNLIHPGPTDTDANPADGPNAETIQGFTALGRYAAAEEIAAMAAHLASAEAGYVTGASIAVDGGFTV
ncbi:MAG: SDR family NAD(P)-dependent oxidoreductase [Micromonosporaceae bacterium]